MLGLSFLVFPKATSFWVGQSSLNSHAHLYLHSCPRRSCSHLAAVVALRAIDLASAFSRPMRPSAHISVAVMALAEVFSRAGDRSGDGVACDAATTQVHALLVLRHARCHGCSTQSSLVLLLGAPSRVLHVDTDADHEVVARYRGPVYHARSRPRRTSAVDGQAIEARTLFYPQHIALPHELFCDGFLASPTTALHCGCCCFASPQLS